MDLSVEDLVEYLHCFENSLPLPEVLSRKKGCRRQGQYARQLHPRRRSNHRRTSRRQSSWLRSLKGTMSFHWTMVAWWAFYEGWKERSLDALAATRPLPASISLQHMEVMRQLMCGNICLGINFYSSMYIYIETFIRESTCFESQSFLEIVLDPLSSVCSFRNSSIF